MSKQRITVVLQSAVLAVLISLLGPGCASPPTTPARLTQADLAGIGRTTVHASLPQDHVSEQTFWYDFSFGEYPDVLVCIGALELLHEIGMTIWQSVEEKNYNRRMKNFLSRTRHVDFRTAFWSQIEPELRNSSWLKMDRFCRHTTNALPVAAPRADDQAALNLRTSYSLTDDFAAFYAETTLKFFLPGQPHPAATTSLSYWSRALPKRGDKAVQLWTTNYAAGYQMATEEAARESAKLLRHALARMCGATNAAQPAKIKTWWGSSKGHILEESDGRIVFQEKNGLLHSFSQPETKIKLLPVK